MAQCIKFVQGECDREKCPHALEHEYKGQYCSEGKCNKGNPRRGIVFRDAYCDTPVAAANKILQDK